MDERYNFVIGRIKDVLSKTLPEGAEAYLYGSRARGDALMGSDWDILLLVDKARLSTSDFTTLSYPLNLLGYDIGEEINPQLYTKQEWNNGSFAPFRSVVNQERIRL